MKAFSLSKLKQTRSQKEEKIVAFHLCLTMSTAWILLQIPPYVTSAGMDVAQLTGPCWLQARTAVQGTPQSAPCSAHALRAALNRAS